MSFYDVAGPPDGLPSRLIHGIPANRKIWVAQVEALAARYLAVARDAQLRIIKQANHLYNREQFQVFTNDVRNFAQSLKSI